MNHKQQIKDLETVLAGQCLLWCKGTKTRRANKILWLEFDLENSSGG